MKKIITSILAILMIILLLTVVAGCDNYSSAVNFTYNFKKVHIFTHDGNDLCLIIEKWSARNYGVLVKTKEYDETLCLSKGTYMLCEDECPICEKKGK